MCGCSELFGFVVLLFVVVCCCLVFFLVFFWMQLISIPCHTVVIEKTSPPLPVEVAPEVSTSSASQVIAPTQVTGIVLPF